MAKFLVLFLSLILTVCGGRNENEKIDQSIKWMKRCECAGGALNDIQRILGEYTKEQHKRPDAAQLDDVIKEITKIAHNCTSRPSCKCPDGYFKTDDGYHCLMISDEKVDCDEATQKCSKLASARLAVAKDHRRLTSLADEIRHVEDDNSVDHYWIGLSYNRTSGGLPLWTWEDGSMASNSITNNLRVPVKKSLIRIDVTGERQAIERVAINKNYKGKQWKQEKCGRIGRNGQVRKHKYICEFVMFNLELKAITAQPKIPRGKMISDTLKTSGRMQS